MFSDQLDNLDSSRHMSNLNAIWESVNRHLPTVSKEIVPVLECTPFIHITKTVVKNAPYTFGHDWDLISEIELKNAYLESAFISGAAFLHNAVMAILYQISAACSNYAGSSRTSNLRFYEKKYQLKTGFSFISFLISIVGVFSGKLAAYETDKAFDLIKRRVWNALTDEVHARGMNAIRERAEAITEIVHGLEEYFQVPNERRMDNLREKIERAQSLEEINELAKKILDKEVIRVYFPRRRFSILSN